MLTPLFLFADNLFLILIESFNAEVSQGFLSKSGLFDFL